MRNCRVCGAELSAKPLLRYRNMPKVAQKLPGVCNLRSDKGGKLDIFQCTGCGLVQLSGKPVPYFREVIRASAFSPEMKSFRLRQFKRFISRYGLKGGRIIEAGCGKGEYLSLMKDCGMKAFGFDYSKSSVEACRLIGLNVKKDFPENIKQKLSGAPFDAFCQLNFLEHLPAPNIMLKCLANNLCKGGIGLVEVPNFDMITKKKLFSEFTADHLFYFTKDTLVTTLELNGFEVLSCETIWYDYIISAVVRKRDETDLTGFKKSEALLKKDIYRFIGKFKRENVAIWGAGHQALAIISLMDLRGKIKYVIDSAPFKQGKFTPASHIRIVPPTELKKDPPEAVIIMGAAYSDEIAGIIRKNFDKKLKVAILRDFGLEIISKRD